MMQELLMVASERPLPFHKRCKALPLAPLARLRLLEHLQAQRHTAMD